MNYRETTEDINKLVDKLANLITDAFKCCIMNYEALLPCIGERETNSNIFHKLVQVNIMLNKLNEELVAIRVEYVADSPFEQKGGTVQGEGSSKRKLSDEPELGRHEAKSMKMEEPFFNSTKYSVGLTSETENDIKSENLVLDGTEVTSNTKVQKLDVQGTINIDKGIQDSNELEDTHKLSSANNKIPVAQELCDTAKNGMSNHFADDEVSADRLMEDNPIDKSADNVTQKETSKLCVELQSVKSETNSQGKHDDSSRGVQEKVDHTTSVFHEAKKPLDNNSAEGVLGLYGIKRHKKKSFKCTLCNCSVSDLTSLYCHVNGKKHQKKIINVNVRLSKTSVVPDNNCKSTSSASIIFVPPTVPCSPAATVESESISIESDSECSAVSCALDDRVVIVEDRHQLMSVKRAVRLHDIWTYFHAPFHINKKFIRFHSGKILCYLCYEEVGRYILSVRKHIARSNHLDRINVLRKIELENKSSNKQLLDVPDFLENVVPATQFSLRNYGFFCNVCNCFCENTVVLSHMTGESHGKMLDEMKKSEES